MSAEFTRSMQFNVLEPFLAEVERIAENRLGADGRQGFMKFFFD
jgi:hypothetical protein